MKKPTTPRMMSTIPRMRISTSGYAPPAKQVDNEYDDGDDEQDMQKSAHRGAADQAHEPQNQQNDDDGPDHGLSSLFLCCYSITKTKSIGQELDHHDHSAGTVERGLDQRSREPHDWPNAGAPRTAAR